MKRTTVLVTVGMLLFTGGVGLGLFLQRKQYADREAGRRRPADVPREWPLSPHGNQGSEGLPQSNAIAKQEAIGELACAPCAVLNMAVSGSEELRACGAALPGNTPEQRVRALIDRHGSAPSTTYADRRNRYTNGHGVAAEDLPDLVNDFLAERSAIRVVGEYLDRTKDEPSGGYLRRVQRQLRGSLAAGVPPILDLRAFAARPDGREFKWQGLMGHYVAVVEIDPVVPEGAKGFRFRFADSYTGRIETGYAHVEEARDFTATRKFSVSREGVEQWEWVTSYPFLLVTAPSLRLLTQKEPWHVRTMIVLRLAVVAKPSVPADR